MKFNIKFLITLFLILLISCSKPDPSLYPQKIIGTWDGKNVSNEIQMTFKKDMNVELEFIGTGQSFVTKYQFRENNSIIIFDNSSIPNVIEILDDNNLKFKILDGGNTKQNALLHGILFKKIS